MEPFLTDVPSGDYAVTITDINGCTLEESSIKYPEPTPPITLVEDTTVYAGISCDSLLLGGRIRILIEGGFGPYQFNWNTGANGVETSDTLNLTELSPGLYFVTVTDDEGCVAELDSIEVNTLEELSLVLPGNGVQDVSCKGGSDGSIQINVNGGAQPYTFIWTNGVGDTISMVQNPDNLPSSLYSVEVTDVAGCVSIIENIPVFEPAQALSVTAEVTDVLCFGDLTGGINITVEGGTNPYTYLWSNLDEDEDISGLAAGPYSVVITDKNDCVLEFDTIVPQPLSPIQLDSFTITHIDCFDEANGMIDISVSGGTPPYIFIWSDNQLTEDAFDLDEGLI